MEKLRHSFTWLCSIPRLGVPQFGFTQASNNIQIVSTLQLPGQGAGDAYLEFQSASGTHPPPRPRFLAGTWIVFPEAETTEAGRHYFQGSLGCGGLLQGAPSTVYHSEKVFYVGTC